MSYALDSVDPRASLGPLPESSAAPPTGGRTVTAPTRHLSAAAYLDDDFRRRCLVEVYHQPRRVVAPSYGFDLVTVLHHCLRARRIAVIRDSVLVTAALVALVCWPAAFALVVLILLVVNLTPMYLRRAHATAQRVRDRTGRSMVGFIWRRILIGASVTGVAGFAIVAAGNRASADMNQTLAVALVVCTIVVATPVVANVCTQVVLTRLGRQRVGAKEPAKRSRLQDIAEQSRGNVVVYSGPRPFVGAGFLLGDSSIPLRLMPKDPDILKTKKKVQAEFSTPPFRAVQLISYIRERLSSLSDAPNPTHALPGMTVTDRVFMAGNEVPTIVTAMDTTAVRSAIDDPAGPSRHFLVCQVVGWDGELVTTLHLHVALQGRTLIVRLSVCALTPCNEDYLIVDDVRNTGMLPYLAAVGRGIVQTPRTAVNAPFKLVRTVLDRFFIADDVGRLLRRADDRWFQFGAKVSIREMAIQDAPRNSFQTQDVVKYVQIMKSRALAAVLDFLDAHGIETSDFRQRSTAIINEGVIFANNENMTVADVTNIHGGNNNQGADA